jgi:hypothetical protein
VLACWCFRHWLCGGGGVQQGQLANADDVPLDALTGEEAAAGGGWQLLVF